MSEVVGMQQQQQQQQAQLNRLEEALLDAMPHGAAVATNGEDTASALVNLLQQLQQQQQQQQQQGQQ
jgi:hypothetical protein